MYDIIPDLIDAGFDILNPVQISAKTIEPNNLRKVYAKDIVFHGGAINNQNTLPFASPRKVKEEAKRLIDIFLSGRGFIAGSVHIIQGDIPVENIVALIEALNESKNSFSNPLFPAEYRQSMPPEDPVFQESCHPRPEPVYRTGRMDRSAVSSRFHASLSTHRQGSWVSAYLQQPPYESSSNYNRGRRHTYDAPDASSSSSRENW